MNKKDFLDKLKKKISILNDEEVNDILNEYSGYIDEKMNDGKTELEAIKELGNINEIANDLLEAYKLKNNKNNGNNIIEKVVNWITEFVEIIVSNIKGKSFSDIIKFGIMIASIFLIILICKIPFIIIENAGVGILNRLGSIGDFFAYIWTTVIEFSYLFVAIIAFVAIVKKQFLNGFSSTTKKAEEHPQNERIGVEKQSLSKKNSSGCSSKIINIFTTCIIFFLKFICFWGLIGVFGYLVGVSIVLVISIYVFVKTLKFIGISILFIGLLLIGIAFAEIGFNFIVNRPIKWKKIFIFIIVSLVSLGSGVGFITISLANTTFKNIEKNDTKDVVYKMNNKIIIEDYDPKKFIIKEDEPNIRVVYDYNSLFVKLNKSHNNHLMLDDYSYSNENKKVINYFMNGLRKDILYYLDDDIVDYKIYINKDNFKILDNNYNKWQKEQNNS